MSDKTILGLVVDAGGPAQWELGTVDRIAELLRARCYGADCEILSVLGLDAGHPAEVRFTTGSAGWDPQDYQTVTVTVHLPDGTTEQGSYQVDGRARCPARRVSAAASRAGPAANPKPRCPIWKPATGCWTGWW